MTDLILILILLPFIITICAALYGVALMGSMGFNRARRKGYNPAEAALLTISLWGIGVFGAAIFEAHRLRGGAGSWFEAFILFWTVFLTVPLVNVWMVKGLPRRLGRTQVLGVSLFPWYTSAGGLQPFGLYCHLRSRLYFGSPACPILAFCP
jgi:hypothetical protein